MQLGNGFLDVFTSFGGLVADALGFKADPKKSEVKDYFDSLAKKLEETKKGLNDLNNNNNAGGGAADAGKAAEKGTAGKADGVQGAIAEISGWLEEMVKAATEAATAANGDKGEMIGKVVKVAAAAAAAKGGDEKSVNGIASGIKGIVEAAEKAGEEGKLESEEVAGGDANADAGKLFAKNANGDNGGGDAADAEKAAEKGTAGKADGVQGAIAEISGWLEEMVKAAQTAATAANGGADMIGKVVKAGGAAAKGGDEKSVNGIASGIKGIVTAAEKAGEEGKLKSEAAGKADAANGGGDAADAEKAAAAVSAVSGKQILKAIVDAAGKGDGAGVEDVKEATNPIEAAIGSTGDEKAAAAFNQAGMKKNDQIAAAIVLRGMAKDGEFALKNADHDNAKAGTAGKADGVQGAIAEISGWLEEMVKAATEAATAANGDKGDMIGKVVKVAAAAAAAKGGEEKSVNGIASGIKGIVEAAEKAGEEGKLESEAVAGGEANKDAGKLFAKNANAANGGGDAADAENAAAASGGTGEMIGKVVKVKADGNTAAKGGEATSVNGIASGIKGIVEAAEKAGEEGKLESEAAAGDGNENAGKLFAKKNDADGGGGAADAEKAAAAVSAVSGKQILKAIVDAAGKAGAGVADVKDATNPIDAAIGSTGDNQNAAAFDKMKKNDQIAAAIVLRGMAKDGEFALNNAANAEKGLKSTVESAVNKTVVVVRRDGKSCY
nr:variable large family protein [Borreliella burgdorferi]